MIEGSQNYESRVQGFATADKSGNGLNLLEIMGDYARQSAYASDFRNLRNSGAVTGLPELSFCSTASGQDGNSIDWQGLYSNSSDLNSKVVLATWGRFPSLPSNPSSGIIGIVMGVNTGVDLPAQVARNAFDKLDPINRALTGDFRQAEPLKDGKGNPVAIRCDGEKVDLNFDKNGSLTGVKMDLPGADKNDFAMLYRVPVKGGWNVVAVNPKNDSTWVLGNVSYALDPTRLFGGNGVLGGLQWQKVK